MHETWYIRYVQNWGMYTARCFYNTANFIQNSSKRHNIARPLGMPFYFESIMDIEIYIQ